MKAIRFGDEELPPPRLSVGTSGSRSLEVTLGRGSELAGVVFDGQDKAALATVVLVPKPGGRLSNWRKVTDTDAFGRFAMRGVPPGEYWVIASPDADPDHCDAASVLEQFGTAGETVTLQGNASRSAEIRLARGKSVAP